MEWHIIRTFFFEAVGSFPILSKETEACIACGLFISIFIFIFIFTIFIAVFAAGVEVKFEMLRWRAPLPPATEMPRLLHLHQHLLLLLPLLPPPLSPLLSPLLSTLPLHLGEHELLLFGLFLVPLLGERLQIRAEHLRGEIRGLQGLVVAVPFRFHTFTIITDTDTHREGYSC